MSRTHKTSRKPVKPPLAVMGATLTCEAIVSVPEGISRRAWECAFELGAEHSSTIGSPAVWHWLQDIVVQRDPLHVTWAECGALFRMHRNLHPARA